MNGAWWALVVASVAGVILHQILTSLTYEEAGE